MAARKKEINLLFLKTFEQTSAGKLLKWALTIGRWIVITTELVVIICFLSRFKFDRELMDLSETIKQQQAIIGSLEDLEANFRNLQQRLIEISRLEKEQIPAASRLQQLSAITPFDVSLTELSIGQKDWQITAQSLSESSFHYFLTELKETLLLEEISLDEVSKKESGIIEFSISTGEATPSAQALKGVNVNE